MTTKTIFSGAITALLMACCVGFAACNEDTIIPGKPDAPSDNGKPDDSNTTTTIVPTLDWGSSIAEVKAKQGKGLTLASSSESLLRYENAAQGITVDYTFSDNKLTGTSMTQAKISSADEMTGKWLKDYSLLAKSKTTVLYASADKSTLAYGKILQGNDGDYASMAWTYIDEKDAQSDALDFTPSGQINGHDYVDLGTGIGWAVHNLGASSPEETGNYYMWGETTPAGSCWWWYYSLYRGDSSSYLDDSKFYTPYTNISGTGYDAARKEMGGQWRMPSRAELYTLCINCDLKVDNYNGVKGIVVTGPSGKSIFLPLSGEKKQEDIRYATLTATLWSSNSYGKADAYYLNLRAAAVDEDNIGFQGKYYGFPIRGVVDLK